MSLGGGSFDQALSNAISNAQAGDVVVVVAAGNEANNNDAGGTPRYPCNFNHSNLVCVAALDQNYALATFSNWGAASVDVGAPGTNILSTWPGSSVSITDPLVSGWAMTTSTSGGWSFGSIILGGTPTQILRNPTNYPSGQYASGTDDRAYKGFNIAGANVAVLEFLAATNIANGDRFRIGFTGGGGDPFAGGTVVGDFTGMATWPLFFFRSFDISGCVSSDCSIGFQLQTDSAQTDIGVGVARFRISTLTHNTTSYNTMNGTSMATPEVSGLAAMLRAYNPQYTYSDTASSIKNGGRPVANLAGRTATGKAIDAMSSLAYLNPPAGVRATAVQ
jgi:subtilisin family serine protease